MDNQTLTPAWSIELRSTHSVARFAAEELRRTLQRMGGPPLAIRDEASGPRITLSHGDDDNDGFVRTPTPYGLSLRGDGPRGLLYAVYDLLEALGCQWVAPDPAGEHIAQHTALRLPSAAVAQGPAFPGRCLILGHDFFLDQAEQWIIWAARNRLNTVFIHTTPRRPALGACRFSEWRRRCKALLPLLRERGMRIELGGHGLRELVPRKLFRNDPELFRFDGQRRVADHNFCASNPRTLAILRQNGTAFFRRYPEADVYHLWPDDLRSGGWCQCPQCGALSPSEQALLAINALAEALATLKPTARIAYLAYHDSEAAPRSITPHPNVTLLYAPRSRSYAASIGDPTNPVNRPFAQRLSENIAHFDMQHAAYSMQNMGPSGFSTLHSVFEYYLDNILFKGSAPPLGRVIQADLRHYRGAGVDSVQVLMTGFRPWLVAPPNAYFFARLAWDTELDPQGLQASYATVRAPHTPEALLALWEAQGEAWQTMLDLTPAEARDSRELRGDLISQPPTDVLDYMAAPRPANERRLERLDRAQAHMRTAQPAWQTVLAQAHTLSPTLAAEQAEWELALLLARFFHLRQQAYVLADRNAPRRDLREALAAARRVLQHMGRWNNAHLPPGRARRGMGLLIVFLGLHLDNLFDRKLALPWQRATLRAQRYAVIGRLVSVEG
jgi:hypothetical protein